MRSQEAEGDDPAARVSRRLRSSLLSKNLVFKPDVLCELLPEERFDVGHERRDGVFARASIRRKQSEEKVTSDDELQLAPAVMSRVRSATLRLTTLEVRVVIIRLACDVDHWSVDVVGHQPCRIDVRPLRDLQRDLG